MPCIFEYIDYRKYLADWFIEKKRMKPSFSYNLFAQKAGFNDKGFFHNVIHGKRELTKESRVKVSREIGHSRSEADYFENLVFFNKSSDLKEKTCLFEKMNSVKSTEKMATECQRLRNDQYEFYSKWYYGAVRSLIDMFPFKNDYLWLARSVFPNITQKQARKAVELLEKLQLIERRNDGFFRPTAKTITTGSEVASLAVSRFHKETADLMKNALATLPGKKRNITGLTLGISEKTYATICEELRIFRGKIIRLAEQDENPDRTYQLNFHLFPLTKTDLKPKEDEL